MAYQHRSKTPTVDPVERDLSSPTDDQSLLGNTFLAERFREDGEFHLDGEHGERPETETDFASERFGSDGRLQGVLDGSATVGRGARGTVVTKVQQALIDLGYLLPRFGVDGMFERETRAAVIAFQHDAGLPETGELDTATLSALDERYANFQPNIDLARGAGATDAEHLRGTRTLSAGDRSAIDEALSPAQAVDPITGRQPDFEPDIAAGNYGTRLETLINDVVNRQFASLADGRAAAHADPANLYDWSRLEDVGDISKEKVDSVFGAYQTGPAFRRGVNLVDRWEQMETDIAAMGPDEQMEIARWRVEKILRSNDDVAALNEEHHADRTRAPEGAIVVPIAERIANARTAELLEIHKGWPGAASDGVVQLQRFEGADNAANRDNMWDLFQTVIHEYIHTLAHDDYSNYADSLDEGRGHTLREGVTDLFTQTTWHSITVDEPLRTRVEGPYHESGVVHPVPELNTYDATAQAQEVVSIAGIRNMYAAFFDGRTDLIGAPTP